MNKDLDPCQDFYGHVCGKFSNPEHLKNNIQHDILTKAVDSIDATKSETKPYFRTMKIMSDQCRQFKNEPKWMHKLFEFIWTDASRNFIHPKFLLSNASGESEPSLTAAWQVSGVMSRLGLPIFGSLQTLLEEASSPRDDLNAFACSSDGSFKMSTEKLNAFQSAINEYLKAPNLNITSAVSEVRALCVDLANESFIKSVDINSSNLPDEAKFQKLTRITPNFLWKVFLQSSFNSTEYLDMIEDLDSKPFVKFDAYIFMEHLGRVFKKHKPRAVRLLSLLSIVERTGSIQELNCIYVLKLLRLHPALVKLYMSYYLNQTIEERKTVLKPIFRAVSSAFSMLLTQVTWLNAKDKKTIRNTLATMTFDANVPDWIESDDERVARVVLFSADKHRPYLANLFNGLKRIHDFEVAAHLKPRLGEWKEDMDQWALLIWNAAYHGDINALNVSLGFTIGHEIMHAFDHHRVFYSKLSAESIEKYFEYSKYGCLAKDYGRFCSDHVEMCINGRNTITENLPDIAGLKAAFVAYRFLQQLSPAKSGVELPGLEKYTDDQLFFLTYARTWCDTEDIDRETLVRKFSVVHPPSKARVSIALRHVPQFAAAFQCPPGSPYTTQEVCDVWGGMAKPSAAF